MEAVVRELSAEDLEGLLALYEHLHAEDDPLPSEQELRRLWEDICADRGLVYMGPSRDLAWRRAVPPGCRRHPGTGARA